MQKHCLEDILKHYMMVLFTQHAEYENMVYERCKTFSNNTIFFLTFFHKYKTLLHSTHFFHFSGHQNSIKNPSKNN